jgi:hypothetical protein
LNHLNGQSRFANTTTTNNNELVFVTGHERSRILWMITPTAHYYL